MTTTIRQIVLALITLAALILTATTAFAFSGFPTAEYPGNQYGFNTRYYDGPWGERMVYGAYGYFPNWNGYAPYGYRTYGYIYTPHDITYGTTMRGGGYGGYGGGFVSRSY